MDKEQSWGMPSSLLIYLRAENVGDRLTSEEIEEHNKLVDELMFGNVPAEDPRWTRQEELHQKANPDFYL
ncbi:MAG TPA: hypothetical protein VJC12_00905 [Candidatus Paceibacterota bacterium]